MGSQVNSFESEPSIDFGFKQLTDLVAAPSSGKRRGKPPGAKNEPKVKDGACTS